MVEEVLLMHVRGQEAHLLRWTIFFPSPLLSLLLYLIGILAGSNMPSSESIPFWLNVLSHSGPVSNIKILNTLVYIIHYTYTVYTTMYTLQCIQYSIHSYNLAFC